MTTKTINVQRIRGKIDFAVITIREDEFEAVLKRFTPRFPVIGGDGKQFYEYCQMRRSDGHTARVAIVRTPDQGQTVAQSVTRDVIDDLIPKWLILTGIAGGFPDSEYSLGDVLVASSLHDFSITAAIEARQPEFRPAGGPVHPAVERLLGHLPAWRGRLGPWNQIDGLGCQKPTTDVPDDLEASCYYGHTAFRETVRNTLQVHFPKLVTHRLPLFKIGAVATANVLLKDTALLDEWRKTARQITHVEMEAGGVYAAARHGAGAEIPLLCIRGISDIVGFKRDRGWTAFACDAAASFLYALIKAMPSEVFAVTSVRSFPRPSTPSAIHRALNFVRDSFTRASEWGASLAHKHSLKSPTVEEITNAFRYSSLSLTSLVVDPNDYIERPEDATIEQFIANEDGRVLCVLGSPGSGKTSLLALVATRAIEVGTVTIGVKADLLPADISFAEWSMQELKLSISALEAIKVAASRTKVLVIVDQLDALASMVDVTSDRLNSIIDFVHQVSSIPGVSVICSCRSFEFSRDTRFKLLNAKVIELELPSWEKISAELAKHGITDSETWPESFRELLRTPQHLQIYLERYQQLGQADVFASYQALLDDLWERKLKSDNQQDIVYRLAKYSIENESLWAPVVLFESDTSILNQLVSEQILKRQGRQIGFQHQTLLEHAKARLFTKSEESLCEHVLSRQDAILVRPTIWAVLGYLRDANPLKYRQELENMMSSDLRLHVRYLLIDFLGQINRPDEHEIVHLANCLNHQEDRLRVLLAIRGSEGWFHAFRATVFPTVMQWDPTQLWPMVGVLGEAWSFAKEDCLRLIKDYWLSDPSKDQLTHRTMREIDHWEQESIDMLRQIIRRPKNTGQRLWWAEDIVYAVSADQPALAPQLFLETIMITTPLKAINELEEVSDESWWKQKRDSPLERMSDWYDLPAVAEAAPIEFLRATWTWFVQVAEVFHRWPSSDVYNQYSGMLDSLDRRSARPDYPIITSVLTSITETARIAPLEFVKITRPTWSSEVSIVHRVVARGFTVAASSVAPIAFEYTASG